MGRDRLSPLIKGELSTISLQGQGDFFEDYSIMKGRGIKQRIKIRMAIHPRIFLF